MFRFVETANGKLLNTAFIKRFVKRSRERDGRRDYYVEAVDSDENCHEMHWNFEPDNLQNIVLPATGTPPLSLMTVWCNDDETLEIDNLPIIGWILDQEPGWPIPIAVGCRDLSQEDSSEHYFIELPSGTFQQVGYEGAAFKDRDAAIAHVVQQERRRQEREAARENESQV